MVCTGQSRTGQRTVHSIVKWVGANQPPPKTTGVVTVAKPVTGWVYFGRGIQARQMADGEVHVRRVEKVTRLKGRNEDLQRASRRNARSVHEFAGMAKISEMSPTQAMEMRDACGDDSDKQMHWLREHPQCRTEKCGAAHLPKKRVTVYSKRKK